VRPEPREARFSGPRRSHGPRHFAGSGAPKATARLVQPGFARGTLVRGMEGRTVNEQAQGEEGLSDVAMRRRKWLNGQDRHPGEHLQRS